MAGLVQVRMLTSGPNKTQKKGTVVSVDAARAAALVADKHAEEVRKEDGNGSGL